MLSTAIPDYGICIPVFFKKHSLKFYILILCLVLLTNYSFAQLAVTQNSNDTALSQMLAGSGVTISNVTKSCNTLASGTFNNVSSTLGLTQGIVLSTGKVSSIPQPASSFASTALTGTGDPQLSTLTTGTIFDPCILEFDVVPQGDTLQFKYVFASEEYPEFVCSQFNDVFGFFITGPNPAGGSFTNKNIALIPNSTLPVCINAVNDGISGTYNGTTWNSNGCISLSYTADYVNNTTPTISPYIVYNGMTKVLSAVSTVVPCQTYHLKIAIADVGDRFYDSGVFLQAYSFSSTPYTIAVTSKINDTAYAAAYEGCMDGTFTVSISAAQSKPVTVALNISGSATNGVDYNTIPDSVTIPAGQTSVTIPLVPVQDNIAEGPETVTVAVLNQCSGAPITSASITIMDDPKQSVAVSDSTICAGQSTQLTATGGESYSWTPAVSLNSSSISNPVATPTVTTTYLANITWGTCVFQIPQTIHVSNPVVSLSTSPADTVCTGTNIQLAASANGGIIPYKFLWSNGSTTTAINSMISGTFSVTATDGYGCMASSSQNLVELNPSLVATATNVLCYSSSTGSVSLSPSDGLAPYTYHWSNGASGASITNAIAGNYSVTSTDSKGCTASTSATITQPASALLPIASVASNVSCFGGNNGAINLNVTGGTPGYTYNWADGATSQNRTNLSGGNYKVIVTDSKGCSVTTTATVTEPVAALAAIATTTNINCFGANTGSITLSVSGGTTPYAYNWGGGVVTQNRNNLAAGTYIVTITDASNCSTTVSTIITQPVSALSGILTPAEISCFGGNNGVISSSAAGGMVPYSYTWSNGATVSNVSNVGPGNYSVTITDAKGCSITLSAAVSQPSAALAIAAVTNNVSCFGSNNGSISLTVTGGTPVYSYSWAGGVTTQNRTNIASGTYNVTVTDSKGCSATASANVTQPAAALTAIASPTKINCFGANTGSINLSVSGGTTPYAYNWGGGVVSQNRNNLTAGTYNVTITDANNCSTTASAVITQPAAVLHVSASNISAVSCFGGNNGSVGLNVTGGSSPYSYSWSNGTTSQTLTGVGFGTYTVSVTDANGCSVTANAGIAQPATALNATLTPKAVKCYEGGNGTINTNPSGGIAPYTFHWSDGNASQNRNNLTAGTYQLTITDANGCTFACSDTIQQPASALSGSAIPDKVSCYGGNNGSVQLTITGGTSPYTYNWNDGVNTASRTGLSAGNYTVTVADANGCSTVLPATVGQPLNQLAVNASSTNVQCSGQSSGAIVLQVNGGTSPYVYNWGNGIVSANRSSLPAGTYTATVTDANGCTVVVSNTITQPSSGLNASAVKFDVACYGDSTGIISVSATGGVAPYNYTWSNGANTTYQDNLLPGNYLITITDANGCSATVAGAISQPAQALKALTVVTNASCNGANNGAITLNVSGGTPPYIFKWNSNSTSQNRTQIPAGNYEVTITDANSCNVVAHSAVTQPAPLAVTLSQTPVSCFNGNNGGILLSATGGTPAYSYNWGNGIVTQNRSQLVAGEYNVTLTDANLCTVSATADVTQPASGLTVSATVGSVKCQGGNDGTIQLTATGGNAPYTFTWTGGDTAQNRSGLSAGTYHVSVSDNHGCNTVTTATITQPSGALSAIAAPVDVNCYNGNTGAVNLSVTGGTMPYTYNWNTGQRYQNISDLYAGTYSVVVNDSNGCSAGASANVLQPASGLGASLVTQQVSCHGAGNGQINLTASGGTAPYSYVWSNGAVTKNIQNLSSGSYQVTVTDAKGCKAVSSTTVNQPDSSLIVSLVSAGVSCFGGGNGSISLQASGGTAPYKYNWGGGIASQNRNGLSAGNYLVTVTDANQCSVVTSTSVAQPASAIAIAAAVSNVTCTKGNNGSISLNVTGGSSPYTYNWGVGIISQNRNTLVDGIYVVTVTDAKGCTAVSHDTITQPQHALSATTDVTSEVSCYSGDNGSIQLTVAGGTAPYSYSWSGGITSQNISNLPSGNYHVTVTDSHGCSSSASAAITQPVSALLVTPQITNIACFGGENGAVNLTASGGTSPYTYNWGAGITVQNRSGLPAGNYEVTVTDSKGCTASLTETVSQAGSAISLTDVIKTPACYAGNNGSISLAATGGSQPYTYKWSDGVNTQNATNLKAGNYSVTVTDAHGCTAATNMQVSSPDSVSLAIKETNPTCFAADNGQIMVSAAGGTPGYKFEWNTGVTIPQISNSGAGTYAVTVTDLNGCTAVLSSIVVNQPAQIILSANVISGACAGTNTGQVNAVVSGGTSPYQYIWSNGYTTSNVSQLNAGSYIVTVTDVNQCSQTASAAIATLPGVTGFGFTNPLSCQNAKGEIELSIISGSGPYRFKWSDGDTTENLYNVHPGSYSVTVQDANGCSFDTSFVIENLNNFSVQASGGATINLGGNSELRATGTGSNQTIYNWTPGNSLSCVLCPNTLAQPAETTTYTVIGTDTNGCTASDTVSVIVIEDYTVFTPNAFTPNGDGNNDYFQIFGNLAGIHSIEIKIFDRWGEKVFESEEPNFKWDGTYKGVLQSPQVFAYEMKIVFNDGHSDELKKGSITLIR